MSYITEVQDSLKANKHVFIAKDKRGKYDLASLNKLTLVKLTGISFVESKRYQKALTELSSKLPKLDSRLVALYAQLAVTTGQDTTLENVHDAWSIYTEAKNPSHKSLVKFVELTAETQAKDAPFKDAIVEVASTL